MPRFMLEDPSGAQSFVCAHTLCMSYVTNTLLLVCSSVRSKHFCVLCTFKGKREQKHTTRNFLGFNSHSPLITLVGALARAEFHLIVYVLG